MSENESRIARLTESDGILSERVLLLVLERMNWDIQTVCRLSAVNTRLWAVAKRLLWRELCLYRAPRMTSHLIGADGRGGGGSSRLIGGWQALAKLLFFCGGCAAGMRRFGAARPSPGHFVAASRFSKTSGRCFLMRRCRGDVLYVSDPCEHTTGGGEEDVGVYRGVFRSFMRSRTRECLIRRRAGFEEGVRCPYCGARVWSMVAARMVPRKVAARRLGSSDDGFEYFVCLNGHLHGVCWLVPLSSDEGGAAEDGGEDEDFDSADDDDDYGRRSGGGEDRNGGR